MTDWPFSMGPVAATAHECNSVPDERPRSLCLAFAADAVKMRGMKTRELVRAEELINERVDLIRRTRNAVHHP